jgi:hyperosmotically inducible protein
MTKLQIAAVVASAAFLMTSVACDKESTNSNAVRNAAVVANANTNVAVVTNSNTSPVTDNDDDDWDADITRADFDRDKAKYEGKAKSSGATIGQGANDLWLWTKTRSALATTDDLRDSTINVDVENDVVTLKGSVGSQAQKTKAETVAKGIDGVKSVKNSLTVGAMTDNKNAANKNARS